MATLVPVAAWHLVALLALLMAAQLSAPTVALAAAAATAGMARSPIFGALRTLWAQLVPRDQLEHAYGVQATVQQASYLVGPLLVGALLALASPDVALVVVTVLTFVAVVAFARTAAARGWRPVGASEGKVGVLRSTGLRALAVTAGLTNATVGGITVALPAFAIERGATPAAGVLLSTLTVGGLLGAVGYGSRGWPGSLVHRYAALLAAFGALVALLAAPRSLALMLAAVLLAGAPLAALMTCRFQLIDHVAPPGAANEAVLWLSAAEAAGAAAGQALAGGVVEGAGTSAAFLLAAAVAAAAAALTLTTRRQLAPNRPRHAPVTSAIEP